MDNEWIEHDGGPCPVENGVMVQVRLRGDYGNVACAACRAGRLRWTHTRTDTYAGSGDIIAYRADNGGPAFPVPAGPGFHYGEPGMTLRDWFAGQVIASVRGWHAADRRGKSPAEIAYIIADEMLAARRAK